ncbi:MAG: hypothetical protein ING29_14550 [Azospirillum sp.]|nr:hypothetical protein [Azospirillum sp.]
MIRNGLMAIFGATALVLGAVNPAAAQIETGYGTITPTVTITSNYIFRGISQSNKSPAVQGNLEYTYGVGQFTPYLGAFASSVRFPGADSSGREPYYRQRMELDLFGGVRYEPIDKLILDAGFISYVYPGQNAERAHTATTVPLVGSPQWNEWYGKLSYDFGPVIVLGSVYHAPSFQAASGSGTYLEGGLDIPVPFDFTVSGRLGRQNVQRNANFGFPDYTTWNVSLGRELLGFVMTGGYSDTNVKRNARLGADITNTQVNLGGDQYSMASGQFFFSVSRKF